MASSDDRPVNDHWLPQDEVLGRLPEPFEEEPESIRQDIADELQDHLLSSLRQELYRTPDEAHAKQNVLDRFGDVRKIARQLWFDWMKGKIMTQRITLATTLLMAIACIGFCFIGWNLLKQNQEFNSAMLEKLSSIAVTPDVETSPPEGEIISIKLRWEGQSSTPPAIGLKAQLSGNTLEGKQTLSTVSDRYGKLDFGQLTPGHYDLTVTTPWDEILTDSITVVKGQPQFYGYVCPVSPLEFSDIKIKINWPDDLVQKGMLAICNFETARDKPNADWKRKDLPFLYHLILNQSGPITGRIPYDDLNWVSANGDIPYPQYRKFAQEQDLDIIEVSNVSIGEEVPQNLPTVHMAQNKYYLKGIDIALPILLEAESVEETPSGPFRMKLIGNHTFPLRSADRISLREGLTQSDRNEQCPRFEVKPDEPNTWTIELPESLVTQVREYLHKNNL